jgi:diguanylate cyclase (GGDEF)-like protein
MPAQPPSGEPDGERALDTLGAVLRSFGSAAFDLDELDAGRVRETFERWAQHVLVAAPVSSSSDGEKDAPVQKQWGALRQFVAAHRKREVTFVQKTVGDFREVIWSFVGIVNRAAGEDKQQGLLAKDRLVRLKAALDGNDMATLRREARDTAAMMESALAEQSQKQTERLAAFATSVQRLGEQLEGARREAALDPLTRVPNRASLDEYLGRSAELNTLLRRPASLLMIDVDRFKAVNDGFGHPAGDAVVREVANCLVRTFPRRTDLVARYGGDEFAVILREVSLKEAGALAQRFVDAVRALRVPHAKEPIRVSVSVGLAECVPGEGPAAWVERADAALYRAKSGGRDRWAL